MTLKQALCGWLGKGHKSHLMWGGAVGAPVTHVAWNCTKCGYKTKWFDLPPVVPSFQLDAQRPE